MKKRFAPVLILILILGAAAFATSTFIQPKNTFILKEDGWHPRTLTVHVGETITFKSERGKYFWPASDPHPTHNDFPAFDVKRALAPSDSWSFTFTESGIYKFHDHLAAFYTGIIRVVGSDGKVNDNCMQHGGQSQCWENEVYTALVEKGLGAAYDVVARLYATEPTFASQCHSVAHNIGLATYQLYRENPKAILSPKATACAAGFYHGFMEGYLGATGDVKGAAAVCEKIGTQIGKESPDARLQCYHGIGHGAIETAVASTGTFGSLDDVVVGALAICEQASTGADERYRCASGLYNGIANLYSTKQYNLSATTTDPLAFCSRQQDVYKDSCYGNMNSLSLWLFNNDFFKAAQYTLSAPDEAYRKSALFYVANLSAVQHIKDTSFAPVITDCHRLPAEYQSECISGFAHGLLEHGSPGKEYVAALTFCGEPSLSATETDKCYKGTLGTLRGWYSQSVSESICNGVAEPLQHYCRK